MPPLSAPYLAEHLQTVGPAMSGGMGPSPLTYSELAAWIETTGRELEPWEVECVREASRAYCAGLHEGREVGAPAPWTDEEAVNRNAVANKVAAIFGSRTKGK